MPHSYGASFAAVGRFGPSRIDATKLRAANRNTNASSENSGRYWSRATKRRLSEARRITAMRPVPRADPSRAVRTSLVGLGGRLLRAAEFTQRAAGDRSAHRTHGDPSPRHAHPQGAARAREPLATPLRHARHRV